MPDNIITPTTLDLFTPRVVPLAKSPTTMVLYGLPKCGKSTICTALPNALHLDMETIAGSVALTGNIKRIGTLADYDALQKALSEHSSHTWDFIILDTATGMERIATELATRAYKASVIGKTFTGDNILDLPKGAGYYQFWQVFQTMMAYFASRCRHLIIIAHVREKYIEGKNVKEVAIQDMDQTGKVKTIMTSTVDCTGYVYRSANDEVKITFFTRDLTGNRFAYLEGKEFVISKKLKDDSVQTYWELFFPEVAPQTPIKRF